MGLGFKGGERPASLDWKWEVKNNQDSAWIGDINAGLQFTLKDDKYVRPLNTNFYTLKPLVMPASWFNGGKGGCRLAEKDAATYLVSCYSGARTIAQGETLFYNFRLLLTPFKPIDPAGQFRTRYFHAFKPVDEVVQQGANVVNVHHANAINPYINYPFFRPAEMKAYIDRAHAEQLRVKIYYTVRELANRAPEIFALRSLGEEIFAPGSGGGYSWLQEHLGSNYIAAWFVPDLKDAAIVNSGVSRWHNFYVEGLDWLARNVGIDGLYIDDVAFDRLTMKRVRKVLDRQQAGRVDRPALGQPVQRPRRVRQQRQPLSRALPLPRPALVRRVLRLQLRARLLADRDLGHSVRPDGRDAAGRRQPVARHGVRHDRAAALGGRPAIDVEGVG